MSELINQWQATILERIDRCNTYDEKLNLLNSCYLNESNSMDQDNILLEMIEELKQWG